MIVGPFTWAPPRTRAPASTTTSPASVAARSTSPARAPHHPPDRVCDPDPPAGGLRGPVDRREHVPREHVHARVDQLRPRGLRLLLPAGDAGSVEVDGARG